MLQKCNAAGAKAYKTYMLHDCEVAVGPEDGPPNDDTHSDELQPATSRQGTSEEQQGGGLSWFVHVFQYTAANKLHCRYMTG